MKKKLLSISLMMLCVFAIAQKNVNTYQLRSVNLKTPILTDSLNALGDRFKTQDLLKTPLYIGFDKGDVSSINTDTSGIITIPQSDKKQQIHLIGFNSYTDQYTSASIKFTTNSMIEVYIDGAKVNSSYGIDSINYLTVNHTYSPKHVYNIVIKILGQGKNITLKCELTSNNKDVAINNTTDTKRFYELTDNFIGTRVVGASISPNGKYVITTYSSRFDTKSPEYTKVLSECKTGKIINPRLSSKARWMPKISKIYYTDKAENDFNITTLCPETLKEEIIVSGITQENFTWSPAENYLILPIIEEAKKNEGPMKYHASQYDKVYGRSRTLLAKYDIKTGISERITFGNLSSSLQDITLDGSKMLFTVTTTDYSHREAARKSLYEINMETFAIDTLLKDQWYLNQAIYSPNATEILLLAGPSAFNNIGLNCGEHNIPNNYDTQAFIMSRENGKIRPISKNFDPGINNVMAWDESSNTIYFKVEDKMNENLYSYNVKLNSWTKLTLQENVIRNFSIDNKGLNAVYTGISMGNSTRAYVYDVKKSTSVLYADPMKNTYNDIVLGKVEDFVFKTNDGTSIDGYVCFPPQYDENKKYPMIVYYYGGTSPSQKWNEFYYGAHLFASYGYMVYVVNPSGTPGYGQEFSARHVNAWGIRTADDIIEGTKLVCQKYSSIDNKHIGCIGASYGGFMTQYLLTKTDIFAGAVSHAGISNIASYWGEGFWGVGYSYVASADSYPWNNAKLYNEQSPLFNAYKINTPILLLHGSVDTNVPVGESVQLYNALKRLGKTVEFIEIEGENHTIVQSLDKQILWHNTIMAWFAKTLYNAPEWWNAQYPKIYTE